MKKIINGKAYNTETSKLLVQGYEGGTLYRKKDGVFFKTFFDPNNGQSIKPMTVDEAKDWVELYANYEYESIFGGIKQ